jgi:molybdate/tungstate transport system permease protein
MAMQTRRVDFIGLLCLIALAHALLFIGELWQLRVHLSHSVNAALFVLNLYFLLNGFLLAPCLSRLRRLLYPFGYLLLGLVFFGLHPDWRPSFFIFGLFYISFYRSPLALGLLGVFILCHVLAQPYSIPAFLTLGAAFALTYTVRRGGAEGFRTFCLGWGVTVFLLLLFPLVCFVLADSPQTLLETYRRPEVRDALRTSLVSASLSTLLTLVFGVPLAYAMARLDFPGKKALDAALDVPILIPHSAVGVAFLVLLGSKGPWGEWVRIPGTMAGILLCQVFVSAPFLIKTSMTAFGAVDVHLEVLARTLGASSVGAFGRIALPLAARGIFVGCILAWSRAISEMGSIAIVAYYPMTAPILVFDKSSQAGLEQARPIAVLLVLCCLWMFIGLQWIRSAAFKRLLAGEGREA